MDGAAAAGRRDLEVDVEHVVVVVVVAGEYQRLGRNRLNWEEAFKSFSA